MAREGPKTAPKESKEGEYEPKNRAFRPKRPPGVPHRALKKPPRSPQEAPKKPKRGPKTAPKRPQSCLQEAPERPPTKPRPTSKKPLTDNAGAVAGRAEGQ